jgi:beta-glucanase (GH16 family)
VFASRKQRIAVSLAAAASLAAAWLTLSPTTATATIPDAPAGFTLTWGEDFNGEAGTLPSAESWIVDTGTAYPGGPAQWGTGEVQTYTNDTKNLQQDGNGNLSITPLRDETGAWTSGRIETVRTDFQAAANGKMRIEARVQVPNVAGDAGVGYWPAFWGLGAEYRGNFQNWPGVGEFDIMENFNGTDSVTGTLHCGVNPGGPCNETTGLSGSRACPGSTCQGNFHTYALEVDRTAAVEKLSWFVDGETTPFHTVTSEQMDAATWASSVRNGKFLLLNLAIGGAFPDAKSGQKTPIAATQPGVPMLVDYVAVYNSAS